MNMLSIKNMFAEGPGTIEDYLIPRPRKRILYIASSIADPVITAEIVIATCDG